MLKAQQGSYVNFEIDYFVVKNNPYDKNDFYDVYELYSFQLHEGDYLSFFDGRDLQSLQIQKLFSNSFSHSNYKLITISSSGEDMFIQFLTDYSSVTRGFRAYFHYIPIEPNCANWLNMTAHLLKSPDYPTIDCSWVITAPSIGGTILIHIESFEVKCTFFYTFDNFLNKLGGIASLRPHGYLNMLRGPSII